MGERGEKYKRIKGVKKGQEKWRLGESERKKERVS